MNIFQNQIFARENKFFLIKTGVVLVLLGIIFRDSVPKLVRYWNFYPAYSHGFLIPFICGYFIYQERDSLINTPVKTSKFGLFFLIVSFLFFIIGRIGSITISFWSLLLIPMSLIYYHLGSGVLRKLWFPFLLSFFAIPLPLMIYQDISFKLQLISSELAVRFMQLFDLPVYNEGNIINLFYTSLEVADACSGIRSIISLITLAVIFSYYFQRKLWARIVLVFSSLPIAIITNSFRVAGTGMIAHFWSIKYAQGFFHEFSGWLVFLLAFMILMGENYFIDKLFNKKLKGER